MKFEERLRKYFFILGGLILCGFTILTGCGPRAENGQVKEILVAPVPVDCEKDETTICLLIKEKPGDEWKIFYGEIEGFTYQEGYEYKLLVQSRLDENSQGENPVVTTRLVEILSKQEVNNNGGGEIETASESAELSWQELQNAAYPAGNSADELNRDGETNDTTVRLRDGEFIDENPSGGGPAITINLAPYRVYGDLDGDGSEEVALILVETSGNSNPLYKLIAMRSDGGKPSPAGGYPLGSDLFIREINIKYGKIQVELREFSSGDPVCCPSTSRRLAFSMEDAGLELISEDTTDAASNPAELERPGKRLDLQTSKNLLKLEREIGFNGVDTYHVRGLAGQRLDLKVVSPFNTVLLSIVGEEDDEVLLSVEEQKTYWSGELPSTQDYTIRVVSVGGDTDYIFEAEISGEGGRAVMIPPEPYWIPDEDSTVDVRAGPGIGFGVIGSLVPGEAIHITGKNLGVTQETRWWQVCCFDGDEGWVRDDQGEVVGSTEKLTIPENSSFGTPEPMDQETLVLMPTDQIIYFTFEGGPSGASSTSKILESLSARQAQATFFITGGKAAQSKDQVDEIIAAGNSIGSHASKQDTLTPSGRDEFFNEITNTTRIIGGSSASCLRPPYSALDGFTRTIAAEKGYQVALWDIDSQDWGLSDPQTVADRVMEQVFPGARILMHDDVGTQATTVAALDQLLESLGEAGYRFVPLCR
jgi:peptidoglycan/xylan/chitin deacetylase (PgdA/CDA1 family)